MKKKKQECELTLCCMDKIQEATVRVNENIEDSSFSTYICTGCAKALGLKEGDNLPEDGNKVNAALKKAKTERLKVLMETMEVIKSGYAGILPNGNIVDRREHPTAIPCQENPLFNTPKPKEL